MHQESWDYFLTLCASATDKKQLNELLEFFLTPQEKESLKTRCLIVKALLEETKTQREISAEHEVSIAKITRGSNELKRISPELKEYLKENLCDFKR